MMNTLQMPTCLSGLDPGNITEVKQQGTNAVVGCHARRP